MRHVSTLCFTVALAVLLSLTHSTIAAPAGTAERFVNGDFSSAGSGDLGAGWQSKNDVTIAQEAGNRFAVLKTAKNRGAPTLWQTVSLPEQATTIEVSGRLRVEDVTAGEKGFQTARVTGRFLDAKGEQVGNWAGAVSHQSPTDGWQDFAITFEVPSGAAAFEPTVVIWAPEGTMAVDDLKVQAKRARRDVGPNFSHWGKEPVETLSPVRGQIVLNGLWKFTPAVGDSEKQPSSGWGSMKVPGGWGQPTKYSPSWTSGLVSKGEGAAWAAGLSDDGENNTWQAVPAAWYERSIDVPADWADRTIVLDLGRLSTDARVWVDQEYIGEVNFPFGEIDITDAVTPGKSSTLRVLVAKVDSGDEFEMVFMGERSEQIDQRKKKPIGVGGLVGDVMLKSRPRGGYVADVWVKPSTRKQQADLQVELRDVKQAGRVAWTADFVDQAGQVAHSISGTEAVRAAERQTLDLVAPWKDPKLWDFENPNLYTLQLSVKGPGIDDVYPQRFGFREFWIDGRQLMLNGQPVRFRITRDQSRSPALNVPEVDAFIDGNMQAGFNTVELWPSGVAERGEVDGFSILYDRADVKGFGLVGALPSMAGDVDKWNQPGIQQAWRQEVSQMLRRYRNHPSILVWIHSANRFNHGDDQNPYNVGNGRNLAEISLRDRADRFTAGTEATQMIKAMDPTRPATAHSGGGVGDIHTSNNYLSFIPFQEQEEWLSEWAKTGDKPFMSVEWGFILGCDYAQGRDGGGWGNSDRGAVNSESWMTEHLANFYGHEAYSAEPEAQKRVQPMRFNGDPKLMRKMTLPIHTPLSDQLQTWAVANNLRSWRTMGDTAGTVVWEIMEYYGHFNGGWLASRFPGFEHQNKVMKGLEEWIEPEPFEPGQRGFHRAAPRYVRYWMLPEGTVKSESAVAVEQVIQPTLAWIGGRAIEGDVAAFAGKAHSFHTGDRVEKQFVLLNDRFGKQPYEATWTAVVNGKTIASDTVRGELNQAETRFMPFAFELPRTVGGEKVDGHIELKAKVGSIAHEDRFAFRVFQPEQPAKVRLVTYDPKGMTTTMLRELGYDVRSWRGGEPQPNEVLVIGREAGTAGGEVPGSVRDYIEAGGRAILFQQQQEWIEKQARLRTGHHVSRRVFPVNDTHSVVDGLDLADLRDWAGSGTLREPYPRERVEPYGWRRGNRGSVNSLLIEKPHRAGWRPILENDFDLQYSPLMELNLGDGLLVMSSLDHEDQATQDAAAAKLTHQMIEHAATASAQPRRRTAYLGGDAWAKQLRDHGLKFERVSGLPTDGLLVLDPEADVNDRELESFVRSGGNVYVLPIRSDRGPLGVKLSHAEEFDGSLDVPDWAEAAGLSPSDLRWRTYKDAWTLVGGDGVEIGADGMLGRKQLGSGVIIFAQLDPEQFNADELVYWRLTRWRQMRAMAQVLANLGAVHAMDSVVADAIDGGTRSGSSINLKGEWHATLTTALPEAPAHEEAHADPGISATAKRAIERHHGDWERVELPGMIETIGPKWKSVDGEAVLVKQIDIPADWSGNDLLLTLGTLDDYDQTFFNGQPVGSVGAETERPYAAQRVYTVPAKLVKPGEQNVIAIRLFDRYGGGGATTTGPMKIEPSIEGAQLPAFYHWDYRGSERARGDHPHRYCRW